MHHPTLPTILLSLSSLLLLLFLPTPALSTRSPRPQQQSSISLHIPPTIPALHHSTRAFLTTHSGFSLVAPLTRSQSFVFNNLTLTSGGSGSESYNLDIGSKEYDFAPMVVVVGDNGRKIDVVRRGVGGEIKRREEGGWEVRVLKAREGWEERSGFNPMSLLKNPMILLGIFGFAFVIGMPYLLDTMDPETRAEFEEQQKKSILNTANRGAATSLQNFDMAAWMAGKTSSSSSGSSAPVANDNGGAAGVVSSSSKTSGEGKVEGSGRSEGAKARRRG